MKVFKDRRELRARVAALEVEKRGAQDTLMLLANAYDDLLEKAERLSERNNSLISLNSLLESEVGRFIEGPIMFTLSEIIAKCDPIKAGEIDISALMRDAAPLPDADNVVDFRRKEPKAPMEPDHIDDGRSPDLVAAIDAVRVAGSYRHRDAE
ncbi:hypothetical protein ACC684_28410 [Rhizobium ruizarguesonis]